MANSHLPDVLLPGALEPSTSPIVPGQKDIRASRPAQNTTLIGGSRFNEAFSSSDPKPGASRLRLAEDDGSKTYENLHRGARSFADGLYTAIRNPGMHTPSGGGEEQLALEQLAAYSLLARWVDQASVQEA